MEALELLATEEFSLLVADIKMPHISGLDLLVFSKQHTSSCKVILMAGESDSEYLGQALVLGAHDYLEKPFEMSRLVAIVRDATGDDIEMSQFPLHVPTAIKMGWRAWQAAFDSVRALSRAIEAKDPYTRRHSEQVAHYCVFLVDALSASWQVRESVRIAALLHDIGKIGISSSILSKSGKLDEKEIESMQLHPILGEEILSNVTLFEHEALLVKHHHENYDGSGYPDGLVGEDIPWGARIIRIADSMDAMLMNRTYKSGFTVEKMLDELVRGMGIQYDPLLARAAVRWCQENPDQLISPSIAVEEMA